MLRSLIVIAATLIGASGALAQDAFFLQVNFDRPGGAYVSLPAADATACAAQCARDGLCLAWSYQAARAATACELKAVVTPARAAPGFASGMASRAGVFAALTGADARPGATGKADPSAPAAKDSAAPAPQILARARGKYQLLGGPDEPL